MVTINIDLGTATEVKILIIDGHNLSDTATITLKGVDPPIFSEAVTPPVGGDIIVYYLSAATIKRYWHLQISDDANPDGYIDIGDIFLGSYMELSKTYSRGFSKGFKLIYDSNRTPYGVIKKRFYNRQRSFIYDFKLLLAADIVLLEDMIDSIASRSTGQLKPFWFNDNADIPVQTWMVDVSAIPEDHISTPFYRSFLEFLEVMRSI